MTDTDRLVLGTAQLTTAYGVANRVGKLGAEEALALLDAAWNAGIRTFDTAQAYGDSERTIGEWCRLTGARPRIVTKLAADVDQASSAAVMEATQASAERLGVAIDSLLLHDPRALERWDRGVGEALAATRAAGLVRRIGVSVYAPAEALRAAELGLEVVQAPYNALDRRFADGVVQSLSVAGVELHLRSTLLQGLLVLSPDDLPSPLGEQARSQLVPWHELCKKAALPPAEVALRFVLQSVPHARVVIGAETVAQIEEIAAVARAQPLVSEIFDAILALPRSPASVVDPRRWPTSPGG